jgi:hypothetical protein
MYLLVDFSMMFSINEQAGYCGSGKGAVGYTSILDVAQNYREAISAL